MIEIPEFAFTVYQITTFAVGLIAGWVLRMLWMEDKEECTKKKN